MARTMEELDRELSTLRAELEFLKQRDASWPALVRQFAGLFTGDAEWEAIHAKIEEERRQPDPDLSEPEQRGSGTLLSLCPLSAAR